MEENSYNRMNLYEEALGYGGKGKLPFNNDWLGVRERRQYLSL